MEVKYCCTNPDCKNEDNSAVVKALEQESIMDDKNLAQMFCPKCKSRLTACEDTSKTK
jgi:hypothetical protein